MKNELNTIEVIEKLKALHQHYIRLLNGADCEVKKAKYSNLAQGVANSIHEVELMSDLIN